MVSFRFGETITIHRRYVSGKDAYGDDVYGDNAEVLTKVPAVPTSSNENDQGRTLIYDLVTVLLPPNTDISAIDAIEVYGELYEVEGRPVRFVSPFSGLNPGIPVTLRRVTG